jgi:hypothetical protein
MNTQKPNVHPGRAEMLELIRRQAVGFTLESLQQTPVGRGPVCFPTLP